MSKPRRRSPEQIIRKLAEGQKLLDMWNGHTLTDCDNLDRCAFDPPPGCIDDRPPRGGSTHPNQILNRLLHGSIRRHRRRSGLGGPHAL